MSFSCACDVCGVGRDGGDDVVDVVVVVNLLLLMLFVDVC